ncbi:putative lipoprotein [Mycoplasma feriruminatoris]|uniref:lipoprotein n=1 Tax=Mycoplasma feriruminatoris TaxID=1179777 RepID=UPI00241F5F84|nr:lipoprotein [Mycoplasma feriruminatoris]WFQ91384.1 putative lipoprotein [Mycoplasma feriruminatoris]
MKKLLTILGSLMISTSGAALVVACGRTNGQKDENKVPVTPPSDKDQGDKKPGEMKPSDKDEKKPGEDKKPEGDKKPDGKKPSEDGMKPGEGKKPENTPTAAGETIRNSHFEFIDTKDPNIKAERAKFLDSRLKEKAKNLLKEYSKDNYNALQKFLEKNPEQAKAYKAFIKDYTKSVVYGDSISGSEIRRTFSDERDAQKKEREEYWEKRDREISSGETKLLLENSEFMNSWRKDVEFAKQKYKSAITSASNSTKYLFDSIERYDSLIKAKELKDKLENESAAVISNSEAIRNGAKWEGVSEESRRKAEEVSDSIINNSNWANSTENKEEE